MDKTVIFFIDMAELQDNQAIAGNKMLNRMRQAGIPVIGALGALAVERGKLSWWMEHVDGRARCVFKWEGEPLAKDLTRHCYTLEKTLRMKIDENEL